MDQGKYPDAEVRSALAGDVDNTRDLHIGVFRGVARQQHQIVYQSLKGERAGVTARAGVQTGVRTASPRRAVAGGRAGGKRWRTIHAARVAPDRAAPAQPSDLRERSSSRIRSLA